MATNTITLADITKRLETVTAEYASLLKQAEGSGCSVTMLPNAAEMLTSIKEELETLFNDDLVQLPDSPEKLEACCQAVVVLNAVNSALSSLR